MALMTRVVELRAMQYRRTFRASIFSSFLNPVLFLAAMGVGLGTYVDRSGSATHALGGLTYLQFLAPGLLAATAMQAAAFESTFPIIAGLQWQKVFHAMYATPISPRDIVAGNLVWIALRLASIAAIFTLVMALFGAAASPLVVLGIPAAVLTGMAFSAPIAAFSATQRTPDKFNAVFRFGITPLFLFSGTFFPVTAFHGVVRWVVEATPLYRGVVLCRELTTGVLSWGSAVSVGYLVAMGLLGLLVVRRRLDSLLLT
jgi:lipooligosaccharide transport system permease protein